MKKAFNMYVRVLIKSEHGKVLLLKQKNIQHKSRWEIPGALVDDNESFDEVISTKIKQEIGYYLEPGRIIGINEYDSKSYKQVDIIMDAFIISGALSLDKFYDEFIWVEPSRITDYPLSPWFKYYLKNNNTPFKDVEKNLIELEEEENERKYIQREELRSREDSINTEEIRKSVKSSIGLLKKTIKRTFHPKEVKVLKTEPKKRTLSEDEHKSFIDYRAKTKQTNNDIELEPEIIVKHDTEEEAETEKTQKHISFNTQNIKIKRNELKVKLDEINKTESNHTRTITPRPKGKRK